MEYGHVNTTARSKINWTAGLAGIIGLASAMGIVPAEAQKPLTDMTLIAVGTLVPIFRTFFTLK